MFYLGGIVMRISEMYHLDKSQYELDFIDVNPDHDIPLFLDPYYISKRDFPFAYEAHRTIKNFFEYLLKQLKAR